MFFEGSSNVFRAPPTSPTPDLRGTPATESSYCSKLPFQVLKLLFILLRLTHPQ